MKMSDIISESQLDELGTAPMGIGQRLATGAMAKLGSKTAAANLDVGKRANQLEATFKQWALRTGIALDNVLAKDINGFLKSQGIPNAKLTRPSYNLTDQAQTAELWKSVAQSTFRAGGMGSAPLGGTYGIRQPAATPAKTSLNQLVQAVQKLSPADRARLKGML